MTGTFKLLALPPELEEALRRSTTAIDELEQVHESTVTPSASSFSPGKQPAPTLIGDAILGLAFTVGIDDALRMFKIPATYAGNASFHVHWTKSTNTDDSGKEVRWQLTYIVFNGGSNEVTGTPTVVTIDDVYEDSGTTTRIVYRTPDLPLVGFIPNYYVSVKIEAITPDGVALAEPVVLTVDLKYDKRVHRL